MSELELPRLQAGREVDMAYSVERYSSADQDALQRGLADFSDSLRKISNDTLSVWYQQANLPSGYIVTATQFPPDGEQLQLYAPTWPAMLPLITLHNTGKSRLLSIVRPIGAIQVRGLLYDNVDHVQRWTVSRDPDAVYSNFRPSWYREFLRAGDHRTDILKMLMDKEEGLASLTAGIAVNSESVIRDELANAAGFPMHQALGRHALSEGQECTSALTHFISIAA